MRVRKVGRPVNPALRAARRRQILDASVELFARRGFNDTELSAVAEVVGIAKATIYRYFRNKTTLFLATVDDGMIRLLASIEASRPAQADGVAVLAAAIRAYLVFFDRHPGYVELFIQERAQFRDRKTPTYFVYRERHREPWRQLVQELIIEGRIRVMPVDRVLDVVGDLLYGAMFTRRFTQRRPSVNRQATAILDVVFHGILGPALPQGSAPARRSAIASRSTSRRRTS